MGGEIKLTIAGNKLDLERQRVVSRQEASDYAESVGAQYFETSAKQNRGIDDLFTSMGKRLLQGQMTASPAASSRHSRTSRGGSMVLIDDEPASSSAGRSGCC